VVVHPCLYLFPAKTRDSHLLFLGRVTEGGNANNLKEMILCALRYHGGLDDAQIAKGLYHLGLTEPLSFKAGRMV
jgi:hypothetical protein